MWVTIVQDDRFVHLIHKWGKWKTVEEGQLSVANLFDRAQRFKWGNYLVQERVCSVCDKKQLHTSKTGVSP